MGRPQAGLPHRHGPTPRISSQHKQTEIVLQVWENLSAISEVKPVEDNYDGSYLTMLSQSGFIFGIINVVGNFGTVFVDQSYWQSAIAAKPSATYKGYILGGLCWFAIPFTLATALGLASRALDLPISASEAGAGARLLLSPQVYAVPCRQMHTLTGSCSRAAGWYGRAGVG